MLARRSTSHAITQSKRFYELRVTSTDTASGPLAWARQRATLPDVKPKIAERQLHLPADDD
jgi:hypothetical protein